MCEGQVSYCSELSLWVCNIFQISKPPYLKGNLIIIFGPTSACRDCRPTSALLFLSSIVCGISFASIVCGMTRRLMTRLICLNILCNNVSIIIDNNNKNFQSGVVQNNQCFNNNFNNMYSLFSR